MGYHHATVPRLVRGGCVLRRLRVGIVGCGWVARHRHVPAYRRSGRADVVAVYDRREDRARELARASGAEAFTGELSAMLDASKIDAVSVCTPPWLHAPQTVAALEAGVHVLVEKPMAMTVAECRTMCDAATRTGAKLAVAHNFLYARSVTKASARIRERRAGRIESTFAFQMSTPRRRLPDWYERLPGQLFFDEAPHLVYLTRRFLGPEEPRVLHAAAHTGDPKGVQKTQNVAALVASGAGLGVLSMTFNASRAEWGLGIVGSEESYVIDLFRDQILIMGRGGAHAPGEVLAQTLGGLAQMAAGAVASGALYASGRLLYGHQAVVEGFLDAIDSDRTPPLPGEDGLRTIAMLDDICRAAGLTS
ncbi:MAG: Gfo/Idh/MocA family protein [Methanobacteriota archaeon]